MNFNMELPGLKGVNIEEMVEQENRVLVYISMPIKEHICPACGEKTKKIHDYRMRKIGHLSFWGRLTKLMYKCRRYRCQCGKRFAEKASFVERYQRYSREANQAMMVQSAKSKTFKEAAMILGTSISTIIRRFNKQAKAVLQSSGSTSIGKTNYCGGRFHYCRYIHWALDEVRRKVQKEMLAYDRKKSKKMRFVLYKNSDNLLEEERWYLNRYLGLSTELKQAYELKEAFKQWFTKSKKETNIQKVKSGLEAFYRKVEEAGIPSFLKSLQTLKN